MGTVEGELLDRKEISGLVGQLPVRGHGNVWGKEIYFEIPGRIDVGQKTRDVEAGEMAYWEEGNSVCIFFGPTPVSRSTKPEPYVPVFKIGRLSMSEGAMKLLESFDQGQTIELAVASDS